MYGWRMKLGVLTPANNVVIEPEYYRVLPEGIAVYTTRMLTSGTHSIKGLVQMEENAMRGAGELAATGVDVIVYACLSTSLAKETGWSEEFSKTVEQETGIHTTTAAVATIEALKFFNAKKIGIGSPFPQEVNDRVKPFVEDYGLEVLSQESLQVSDEGEIGRIQPDAIYRLGRAADRHEADAVCLMATDISTLDIIESLEKDLGKPVVTTNQAILWKAMTLCGVLPHLQNCGSLLRVES